MTYTFHTDKNFVSKNASILSQSSGFDIIEERISELFNSVKFSSQIEYTRSIYDVLNTLSDASIKSARSSLYNTEIKCRLKNTPLIEPTPWGLVSLKEVDVAKNHIRKLLVVKKCGVLGFEYHERKLEKLKVLDGLVLILYSCKSDKNWKKGRVTARVFGPDDRITLKPYEEHGMIAVTNAVVEETSTNDLDDLLFIYTTPQCIEV